MINQAITNPFGGGTISGSTTFRGAVTIEGNLTVSGTTTSVVNQTTSGTVTMTVAAAAALAVGPNGNTNPTLRVVTNTAAAATGLSITSAAAASGLAIAVLSSGANENLTINALGTGTISLNATATGGITLGRATTVIAGTAAAPSIVFNIATVTGFFGHGTGRIGVTTGNAQSMVFGSTRIIFSSAEDLVIGRGSASNIYINATTASGLWVYGTSTGDIFAAPDTTNFERFEIVTQVGNTLLRQAQGGTGTPRGITITNIASAAGVTALTVTQSAHTAITAEQSALTVAAVSLTLSSGVTIAEHAWLRLAAPTFVGVAGGAAETITDAVTLLITGAPVQGADATLTRTQAIWVQGGVSRFAGELWMDTPAAIGVALADTVKFKVTDEAAGDARFRVQSELGSPIILGNDTVRATWATQATADATVDFGVVTGTTYSLVRITSSLRYKNILGPLVLDSSVIYNIPLVEWESRADDWGRKGYSPVAEYAHEAHPTFAQLDQNGEPVGINWPHLNTAMLMEIQRMNDRLLKLERKPILKK